ncbi:MAG: helix-turn-helix domain-containing protein [Candidatus Diapherotrites archaeon]|nr:helix-turn-helix domain-containing protein [Candidatus Micrarchaeota archaeon]MBU1939277.1 helix-turn-helix domain-containing protein [Candidatus Micrarchaeota archaeon]
MWAAKFRLRHEHSLTGPYAAKHNITILAFPLNYYKEGDRHYITTSHLILGKDKDKEEYFKHIVKNKRIIEWEREGDLLIYTLWSPAKETHTQIFFTPQILFSKPIAVKPDGWAYYEVSSWKKEYLTKLIDKIGKWAELDVQGIGREKVTDVYIPHLMPSLTKKQRDVILFAYKSGYYDYPKSSNIERLAKQYGIGMSTFQEHLRKAEEKLMPFLLENIAQK